MLRVNTNSAVPGMMLALPVYHPTKPGHVLLKPGAELDAATIVSLVDLKVGVLWVRYPGLEFLIRYSNPAIIEQHQHLTAILSRGLDEVAQRGQAPLDFGHYASAVADLIDRFIDTPDAALFFQDVLDSGKANLDHASNTCFVSLLLGLKLDGYLVNQRGRLPANRAKRIENLGLGAMLHDIGILRLPAEAQERWHRTHALDDAAVRRHVLLGFEMLRGRVPATASAVALHHHQKYDGGGFPAMRRLDGTQHTPSGSQIHIFSRIVAVADTFDRLRYPPTNGPGAAERLWRPRTARPTVRVLNEMLAMAKRREIDPVVYRALLAVAPAYGPGSLVRLSDGVTAVVTGWDPLEPCRPTVRVLLKPIYEGVTDQFLGDPLDLRERTDLSVVEVDGQEVAEDNFYLNLRKFVEAMPQGESILAQPLSPEATGVVEAA